MTHANVAVVMKLANTHRLEARRPVFHNLRSAVGQLAYLQVEDRLRLEEAEQEAVVGNVHDAAVRLEHARILLVDLERLDGLQERAVPRIEPGRQQVQEAPRASLLMLKLEHKHPDEV